MTCYNETRDKDMQWNPRTVRDGNNVREIAENAPDFVGHVRPRRWVTGSESEQEKREE